MCIMFGGRTMGILWWWSKFWEIFNYLLFSGNLWNAWERKENGGMALLNSLQSLRPSIFAKTILCSCRSLPQELQINPHFWGWGLVFHFLDHACMMHVSLCCYFSCIRLIFFQEPLRSAIIDSCIRVVDDGRESLHRKVHIYKCTLKQWTKATC